jgi:two-component system, NtrC family, response regulator AtoC
MAAPTVRDSGEPPDDGGGERARGYCLLVLGPDHSETLPLPPRATLDIGRGEDAGVRIVDALASRVHARLHVGGEEGLAIEDLGSANGTRLRDQRLPANVRTPLATGDAVTIGTTVLVVQRGEPPFRPRRLWPHGYFETRLIETCAQAEKARGTFALVRLHVEDAAGCAAAETWLVEALRPGDLVASYGPAEYEILIVDTAREKAEALAAELVAGLRGEGVVARVGVAFFPADGTSPQALVSRACQRVLPSPAGAAGAAPIVLANQAMRELYELAERAARGTINVLIVGETGVGKDVLAETVHRRSPRSAGPFVCLNCAALGDALLESELFGHEKGAFTGAVQAKVGLVEAASSGTLFLDEIGEMSLPLQAKVLRAIEAKEVLPVGATRARPVDVRFVAATNRDLDEEIAARRFRQDLYFRLNGITLAIPPLRERRDEIPALADLFLAASARQVGAGHPAPRLAPEALAALVAYDWPGNIRELRNVIERAVLFAAGGPITLEHLPVEKMRRAGPTDAPPPSASARPPAMTMVELEKQAIIDALERCAGNQTRAAELLGMPRRTFCKRLAAYNIARPRA